MANEKLGTYLMGVNRARAENNYRARYRSGLSLRCFDIEILGWYRKTCLNGGHDSYGLV